MKSIILPLLLSIVYLVQGQVPDTAILRLEIDSLIELNNRLLKKQNLDGALLVMQQAEEKCLAAFGEETILYADITDELGKIYYYKGDYSAVEPNWLTTKNIREKVLGKENPSYASSLNRLAVLYHKMGDYIKSEPLFLEAKSIREKVLGKEHPDYANTINNLGVFYNDMGQYEKAEPFCRESKAIREKVLGKEHPDYAMSLNNLASLYYEMGDYKKVEPLWLEAKSIREKVFGKEHPLYASSLNNLGALYNDMGQYEKAEHFYRESKAIREKVLGKEHPDYATSLHNLARLYHKMGDYKKVEPLWLEAKSIKEKVFGKEHPRYASSLNTLGLVYERLRQYEKAEPLFLEALSIKQKTLGKEHPDYASTLNNLASLYHHMGDYKKVEPLFLEAKSIQEKVLGKEHPDYAISLYNLGLVYKKLRQYEKAEPLFLEALSIQQKILGKEYPDYAISLRSLADLYIKLGQKDKAGSMYSEVNEIRKAILSKASRHLSEKELINYNMFFIDTKDEFLSLAQTQLGLLEDAFDNSLFYKGFILNATQQVNRLAQTDSMSTELFYKLKSLNRRLATAYSKPISERDSNTIASLEEKANTLEKELTRTVAGFGEAIRQVTWQEVQAQLQPGEAAIEFVDFKYRDSDPTDSILYAALLLKPGDQQPQFISLFEEKSLDSLLVLHQERRSDYVNDLYSLHDRGLTVDEKPVESLYELMWQPLEKELAGTKTIYFSPSGLLHRINLNAIPVDDEKTIADHYNLVQLLSTRSLVTGRIEDDFNDRVVLYGGIQYESDSMAIAFANENLLEESLASRGALSFTYIDTTLRGGKWNYLNWTQKEVEAIKPILETADFKTEVFSGYFATEEAFRALSQKKASPRILHIATHGFFFPDVNHRSLGEDESNLKEPVFKTSNHPMIRSGLILAGGNRVWQGNPALANMEDGILTAYEISQMDLSHTELVVLSACETGLGDIEGNEGVYGLQRAFKIAGAKYLIMSLWQVPDRQTKDFMVTFYQQWLEDKMTIPDAFRKTQLEMKERFYDPYQWAGFVLVE